MEEKETKFNEYLILLDDKKKDYTRIYDLIRGWEETVWTGLTLGRFDIVAKINLPVSINITDFLYDEIHALFPESDIYLKIFKITDEVFRQDKSKIGNYNIIGTTLIHLIFDKVEKNEKLINFKKRLFKQQVKDIPKIIEFVEINEQILTPKQDMGKYIPELLKLSDFNLIDDLTPIDEFSADTNQIYQSFNFAYLFNVNEIEEVNEIIKSLSRLTEEFNIEMADTESMIWSKEWLQEIEFEKYSAFGNHFVIIDERSKWPLIPEGMKSFFAVHANDFYFGVGSNDILFIQPPELELIAYLVTRNKIRDYLVSNVNNFWQNNLKINFLATLESNFKIALYNTPLLSLIVNLLTMKPKKDIDIEDSSQYLIRSSKIYGVIIEVLQNILQDILLNYKRNLKISAEKYKHLEKLTPNEIFPINRYKEFIEILKNKFKEVLRTVKMNDVDVIMRIIERDGSEADMCGNGIRCVADYLFKNPIQTLDGQLKPSEKLIVLTETVNDDFIPREIRKSVKGEYIVNMNELKPVNSIYYTVVNKGTHLKYLDKDSPIFLIRIPVIKKYNPKASKNYSLNYPIIEWHCRTTDSEDEDYGIYGLYLAFGEPHLVFFSDEIIEGKKSSNINKILNYLWNMGPLVKSTVENIDTDSKQVEEKSDKIDFLALPSIETSAEDVMSLIYALGDWGNISSEKFGEVFTVKSKNIQPGMTFSRNVAIKQEEGKIIYDMIDRAGVNVNLITLRSIRKPKPETSAQYYYELNQLVYERGMGASPITLACGTGMTSSAVALYELFKKMAEMFNSSDLPEEIKELIKNFNLEVVKPGYGINDNDSVTFPVIPLGSKYNFSEDVTNLPTASFGRVFSSYINEICMRSTLGAKQPYHNVDFGEFGRVNIEVTEKKDLVEAKMIGIASHVYRGRLIRSSL